MLANVQQTTIKPIIEAAVAKDTLVHTDEYSVYARLETWGYQHKTVCHGRGEYARDEDGDGFCEVHVNTIEGFWSLLRSWLRPHRGLSQDKLPGYLGFFSSCTTLADAGRLCSVPSSQPWLRARPNTPQPIKSQSFLSDGTGAPRLAQASRSETGLVSGS